MRIDPIQLLIRFHTARSGWSALPTWARRTIAVLALPGLACLAVTALLLILMLLVSIAALLLPTVPAYRLLRAWTGRSARSQRVSVRVLQTPE